MVKLYAVATALQKDEVPEDKLLAAMGAKTRITGAVVAVVWGHAIEQAKDYAHQSAIAAKPGYKIIDCAAVKLSEEVIRQAARDLGMKD